MANRHMITANSEIFAGLDDFCAARGFSLRNAGKPRWIASESVHHNFLMRAKLRQSISFSGSRKLALFDMPSSSFLCSVGFDQELFVTAPIELELDPAFLTVALYELKPRPIGSVSDIRNVVEVSDHETPSYSGHPFDGVATLFPPVRFFEIAPQTQEQIWSVFFRTCIEECEFGPSWIEARLADALRSMCALDPDRIPYQVLCRSVFDGDPSNFFLAQYRCLEALYAYSGAEEVISALRLEQGWADVAVVLEEKLGWHPREEESLVKLLKYAHQLDLDLVISATARMGEVQSDSVTRSAAAKRIYALRNSIVHYRPAYHRFHTDVIDWPLLCEAMTGIVIDVYNRVFINREL